MAPCSRRLLTPPQPSDSTSCTWATGSRRGCPGTPGPVAGAQGACGCPALGLLIRGELGKGQLKAQESGLAAAAGWGPGSGWPATSAPWERRYSRGHLGLMSTSGEGWVPRQRPALPPQAYLGCIPGQGPPKEESHALGGRRGAREDPSHTFCTLVHDTCSLQSPPVTRHTMTWGPGPKTLVRMLRMQALRAEVPGESAHAEPWWDGAPPPGFSRCGRPRLPVGRGLAVHTARTPGPFFVLTLKAVWE